MPLFAPRRLLEEAAGSSGPPQFLIKLPRLERRAIGFEHLLNLVVVFVVLDYLLVLCPEVPVFG